MRANIDASSWRTTTTLLSGSCAKDPADSIVSTDETGEFYAKSTGTLAPTAPTVEATAAPSPESTPSPTPAPVAFDCSDLEAVKHARHSRDANSSSPS